MGCGLSAIYFDDKHRRIDVLVCWLDGILTCENTNRAVNFFYLFLNNSTTTQKQQTQTF